MFSINLQSFYCRPLFYESNTLSRIFLPLRNFRYVTKKHNFPNTIDFDHTYLDNETTRQTLRSLTLFSGIDIGGRNTCSGPVHIHMDMHYKYIRNTLDPNDIIFVSPQPEGLEFQKDLVTLWQCIYYIL